MADFRPARTRFSTEGLFTDLPSNKAGRAWRDFCAEHIASLDIELREDDRFEGAIEGLSLNADVSVARPALYAKRIARTAAAIRADQDDRVVLIIHATGAPALLRQRGREVAPTPGNALLYSQAHPAELFDVPSTPCLQIVMSHQLLSSRVANPEDLLAMEARANPDALRLLTSYTRLLLDDKFDLGNGLAAAAAAHLLDLASLVLGTDRDSAAHAQEHGVRAARRLEVLQQIAAGFGDPRLSASSVAARLGITPRYVHLLLEQSGRSFSQHLNDRRLAAARAMLADPRQWHLRIADIAYAAGFTDVSHFNRSFRQRYGMTPSDVRAQAIRDGAT